MKLHQSLMRLRPLLARAATLGAKQYYEDFGELADVLGEDRACQEMLPILKTSVPGITKLEMISGSGGAWIVVEKGGRQRERCVVMLNPIDSALRLIHGENLLPDNILVLDEDDKDDKDDGGGGGGGGRYPGAA